QAVAHLGPLHLGGIRHDLDRARADPLADRPATDEDLGTALEPEALLDALVALGLHGLGPGLQDVELAVDAVTAPFDVHRALVMALDDEGGARELDDLVVRERIAAALGGAGIDRAHGAPDAAVGRRL